MKRYLKQGFDPGWLDENGKKMTIKIGGTGDFRKDNMMFTLYHAVCDLDNCSEVVDDKADVVDGIYWTLRDLPEDRVIENVVEDLRWQVEALYEARSELADIKEKIKKYLSDLTAGKAGGEE